MIGFLLPRIASRCASASPCRRRVSARGSPRCVFPGNLQGWASPESGPKGAALVTIRNGRLAALEHRVLDVFRWCRIEIPIAGERHVDSVMDRVGHSLSMELEAAEGRPIAARVTLTGPILDGPDLDGPDSSTGPTPLDVHPLAEPERVREGVIAEARRHGADAVWIELIATSTVSTADLRSLVARPDVIGRLSRILDDLAGGPGTELLGDYPDRLRRIPTNRPAGRASAATSLAGGAVSITVIVRPSEHPRWRLSKARIWGSPGW